MPSVAKRRDPAQRRWPVTLDHCFARIILDNAVGKDVPWMSVIKSPAYKNMTTSQLRDAIRLGNEILEGKADLVQLNQRSLEIRGKEGPAKARRVETKMESPSRAANKTKRAAEDDDNAASPPHKRQNPKSEESQARDAEHTSFDISILDQSKDLTPYRRRVLALLYTVPKGRWTTYKVMSDKLQSSARAVGNAMRNNPYAPMIPCHRVLAADRSIGGFGGEWGADGMHAKEKLNLLRKEGVRFDGKGRAVGVPYAF